MKYLLLRNSAESRAHFLPNKLSWRFGGSFCPDYLWWTGLKIVLGMQFPAEILLKFLLEIQIPPRTCGFAHLWVKITSQTSSSLNKVPFWLSCLQMIPKIRPCNFFGGWRNRSPPCERTGRKNGQAPIFIICNNLSANR